MLSDDLAMRNLSRHIRILGICWFVYGIICLVAALWLVAFEHTATMMFGALLGRVPDPFALMSDFHFIYGLAIVFAAVCGVLGFVAGLALLASQRFGRNLALIAGFLSLSNVPLGTTLGIYTLIVLLPVGAGHAPATTFEAGSSNLRSHPVTM